MLQNVMYDSNGELWFKKDEIPKQKQESAYDKKATEDRKKHETPFYPIISVMGSIWGNCQKLGEKCTAYAIDEATRGLDSFNSFNKARAVKLHDGINNLKNYPVDKSSLSMLRW